MKVEFRKKPVLTFSTIATVLSCYMLLAFFSLVGASFIWASVVDKLCYCSDRVGAIDFIPPFVHLAAGDYYIAPAWVVWAVWVLLVTLALGLPALIVGSPLLIFRGKSRAENKQARSR